MPFIEVDDAHALPAEFTRLLPQGSHQPVLEYVQYISANSRQFDKLEPAKRKRLIERLAKKIRVALEKRKAEVSDIHYDKRDRDWILHNLMVVELTALLLDPAQRRSRFLTDLSEKCMEEMANTRAGYAVDTQFLGFEWKIQHLASDPMKGIQAIRDFSAVNLLRSPNDPRQPVPSEVYASRKLVQLLEKFKKQTTQQQLSEDVIYQISLLLEYRLAPARMHGGERIENFIVLQHVIELLDLCPELLISAKKGVEAYLRAFVATYGALSSELSPQFVQSIAERIPLLDVLSLFKTLTKERSTVDFSHIAELTIILGGFATAYNKASTEHREMATPEIHALIHLILTELEKLIFAKEDSYSTDYRFTQAEETLPHIVQAMPPEFLTPDVRERLSRCYETVMQKIMSKSKTPPIPPSKFVAPRKASAGPFESKTRFITELAVPPMQGQLRELFAQSLTRLELARVLLGLPDPTLLPIPAFGEGEEYERAQAEIRYLLEHPEALEATANQTEETLSPLPMPGDNLQGGVLDPSTGLTVGIELENVPPQKARLHSSLMEVKIPEIINADKTLQVLHTLGIIVDTHGGQQTQEFASHPALHWHQIHEFLDALQRMAFLHTYALLNTAKEVSFSSGTFIHLTVGDAVGVERSPEGLPVRIPPEFYMARHATDLTGYGVELDPHVFGPFMTQVHTLLAEDKFGEAQTLIDGVLADPLGYLVGKLETFPAGNVSEVISYYDNSWGEVEPASHRTKARKIQTAGYVADPNGELYQNRIMHHRHPLTTKWLVRDLTTANVCFNELARARMQTGHAEIYRDETVRAALLAADWDSLPLICDNLAFQLHMTNRDDLTPTPQDMLTMTRLSAGLQLSAVMLHIEQAQPRLGPLDQPWGAHANTPESFQVRSTEIRNGRDPFSPRIVEEETIFVAGHAVPNTLGLTQLSIDKHAKANTEWRTMRVNGRPPLDYKDWEQEEYRLTNPKNGFAKRIMAAILNSLAQPNISSVLDQDRGTYKGGLLTNLTIGGKHFMSPTHAMQAAFERVHQGLQAQEATLWEEFVRDIDTTQFYDATAIQAFTAKWETDRARRNTPDGQSTFNQAKKLLMQMREPTQQQEHTPQSSAESH